MTAITTIKKIIPTPSDIRNIYQTVRSKNCPLLLKILFLFTTIYTICPDAIPIIDDMALITLTFYFLKLEHELLKSKNLL